MCDIDAEGLRHLPHHVLFERFTMRRIIIATLLVFVASLSALAQDKTLQSLLVEQHEAIQKPSRGSVDVLVAALLKSGLPEAKIFLLKWRDREVCVRKSVGAFFLAKPDGDLFQLIDVTTGAPAGAAKKGEIGQLKPNSGVQVVVSSALVQFQLSDPDVTVRSDALGAIEKDPQPSQLAALRAAIATEEGAQDWERRCVCASSPSQWMWCGDIAASYL